MALFFLENILYIFFISELLKKNIQLMIKSFTTGEDLQLYQ